MSLQVDIREDDVLRIGEARIKLIHKSGRLVRLDVEAPTYVAVEITKTLNAAPKIGFKPAQDSRHT